VQRPNRLFDTDAQGRPHLRCSSSLVAGQLRRYAACRPERRLFTGYLRRHPWRLLLSPHGRSQVRAPARRCAVNPPPSGAVGFWPAPVSAARHSLPLQFAASRPMVTLGTAVARIAGFSVWAQRPLRTGCRFGQGLCAGARWKLASMLPMVGAVRYPCAINSGEAECITSQSRRTHKCVRALRARASCAPLISDVRATGANL
jgi:hypothetical protein